MEENQTESLLKKQLLQQKIQTGICIAGFVLLLITAIILINFVSRAEKLLKETGEVVTELHEKVDALETDRINNILEQTEETLGTMQVILGTMNEAVEKVDSLLTDIKQVSDTINSVKEKVDSVTEVFQW